jgi:hypothetical protein
MDKKDRTKLIQDICAMIKSKKNYLPDEFLIKTMERLNNIQHPKLTGIDL